MKPAYYFLLMLFVASLTLPARAQTPAEPSPISWMSFEKAIETNAKTKKNKKKIFIDVYTTWCGWCVKMDNSTFKDPAIVEVMNKYFLPVKFNAEQKDSVVYNGTTYRNTGRTHELAVTLLKGQLGYPAFVILDTDGKTITTVKGYRDAAEFIHILRYYGEDIYLTQSWEDYQNSR